jgi:TP901 family phage tail tape measure protein
MTAEALKLGASVPSSLDQVTKSLFDTVSAGVDAAEAVETVAVASKLAVAGLTDVSVATDGITSALNAYGLSAEMAESVAAKFFTAQKAGKTTIEELASGFGLVGASANAMGVSLNEVLSAVSAVTTAGVKTNSAYTGLKAVFANVAKPTAEAAKEAKRLGIEFNAAALRSQGLAGFLDQVTSASGFTKDSITQLFGSVEAQNIIFALAGQQGENFSGTLKELGDTAKTTNTFLEAFAISNESLENQTKILANRFNAFTVLLGQQFEPILSKVVGTLNKFFEVFQENPELAKTVALVVGLGAALTGLTTALALAALAYINLRS